MKHECTSCCHRPQLCAARLHRLSWQPALCLKCLNKKEVVRTPGVAMIRDLLSRWPVIKQFENGSWRGTGEEAMSERTKLLQPKNHGAEVARSVCPYCGVGCGQLVFH